MPVDKRPGWYTFTPFLGRPPPLTARRWRVLGLVASVSFFEMYDMYLFTLNLKQIQADLMIAEGDLGLLGSFVRAGGLLGVIPALLADRAGRRRMLLITVIAYTLLTGATAFSPNAESFVVLQFLARGFAVAETILATVVIVEEFAPEHRGWGVGAAGAIQASGAGLASVMYGFVEILPFGWRSLYLIGLLPLVLIAYCVVRYRKPSGSNSNKPDSVAMAFLPACSTTSCCSCVITQVDSGHWRVQFSPRPWPQALPHFLHPNIYRTYTVGRPPMSRYSPS